MVTEVPGRSGIWMSCLGWTYSLKWYGVKVDKYALPKMDNSKTEISYYINIDQIIEIKPEKLNH